MQALNYIEKIVGKDNLEGFLKELKSALKTVEKQNEKSEVDISVKGGDDLNGIAAETFTISKEKYSEYITEEKDYMKDAVSIMTVKINAKDASTLPTLQTLIEAQKGMIMELPFVKEKGDKISINTRVAGTTLFVDAVVKDDAINKALQEIGIDLGEFHTFAAAFKTGFKPGDFFALTFDELAVKVLSLLVSVKGTLTNGRYLGTALLKALETVKVSDEKLQKKIKKAKMFISFMSAFSKLNFNFEYCPKQLLVAALPPLKKLMDGQDPAEQLEGFKAMAEGMGGEAIKPVVESMGLLEPLKSINFDEITVSVVSPKFKTGIAHSLKLPGVTELLNTKFLA